MAYIIKDNEFVNIKLTQKGREQLAKGMLNFSYWTIGDSEINYSREELRRANSSDPALSQTSRILRPKDQYPDITSFVTPDTTTDPFNELNQSNIQTIQTIVNNEAKERGFFAGAPFTYNTDLSNDIIQDTGSVNYSAFTGGRDLDIGSGFTFSNDDFILFKFTTKELGSIGYDNSEPTPHLWYQIESGATSGGTITVDRDLPNLSLSGNTAGPDINFIIYPNGEVYNTIGNANTTAYWNTATLSFDSNIDVSCEDVPVWNMNNVWCEDLAGLTGDPYENYTKFGSYPYLGQKYPYFDYDCDVTSADTQVKCEGLSQVDQMSKSVSLIHYTNNTISNFYGEFFYINNDESKTFKVHLPNLMYHRRLFTGGTEDGDEMGMTFVASGDPKTIDNSEIEYYDLIEHPSLSSKPKSVGKVFPQLKMAAFDDDELVAANSYKSNRNWTLPALDAELANPSGSTDGILGQGEVMYMTYILENDETTSGFTTPLHCQTYSKITNRTPQSKDVKFNIESLGLLPYMRKIEKNSYDGRGFYASRFKLVYQKVSDPLDRPDPSQWRVYDFTSTNITTNSDETIDPLKLENQTPEANDFVITKPKDNNASKFSIINTLNMPLNNEDKKLQFGDERFLYGNIETYIGSSIYKTIFNLQVGSKFNTTTNITMPSTNPPDVAVSEVGIYDDNKNLVLIGKLNKPITLKSGRAVLLELSIDF